MDFYFELINIFLHSSKHKHKLGLHWKNTDPGLDSKKHAVVSYIEDT